MIAEDLHTRFRVGVVCWLEAESVDAHLGKKDFHEAYQSAEGETIICDYSLDLVKLGEMCSIDGFISENAIDAEVAGRPGVGGEFVQHVC